MQISVDLKNDVVRKLTLLRERLGDNDFASVITHLVEYETRLGHIVEVDADSRSKLEYYKKVTCMQNDSAAIASLLEWFRTEKMPTQMWANAACKHLFLDKMPFDTTIKTVRADGAIVYLWVAPTLLYGPGGYGDGFDACGLTAEQIWPDDRFPGRAEQVENWDRVVINKRKVLVHEDHFDHGGHRIHRIGIRFPISQDDNKVKLLGSLGIDCLAENMEKVKEALEILFTLNRR